MKRIRAAYVSALSTLREIHVAPEHRAQAMCAAARRIEEEIRRAQQAGILADDLDARSAAELLVLLAAGVAAWEAAGTAPDAGELVDSFLALVERRPGDPV